MTSGAGETILFKCSSEDQTPVLLSGDSAELGEWHADRALAMQPSGNGPKFEWCASVTLPLGRTIEFKFIKRGDAGVLWEAGNNRRYTVISGNHTLSDSFRI